MCDPAEYCRRLETHLCRKNDGHLIRIVGPTFDKVSGWASMGVPLSVACRGVDRYCERYYAKGPRRRPVRLEFCEADVLDEFDRWRRAVGVSAVPAPDGGETPPSEAGRPGRTGLPRHLDRVLARLTTLRASRPISATFGARIDAVIDELDQLRAGARGLRGETRAAALARLAALDRDVLTAARQELQADRESIAREAEAELRPFRTRMNADAWRTSVEAAVDRTIRDRLGLPTIELT